MPKSDLLSEEERRFLAALLSREPPTAPTERSFVIDGGETANALLVGLASQSTLSMESHFPDGSMSFPMTLVEDEFHTLRLVFGAPRIFEHGRHKRPWRLRLDAPLPLLNHKGQKTGLCVHELSPNGMLVDVSVTSNPPQQFSLWLALPAKELAQEPIEVRCTLVRPKGSHLAAYRLKPRDPADAEKIRLFIFLQHRLQHPELEDDTSD